MNYLIIRKSEREIEEFIKDYPFSYAAQIAEFLNSSSNYIRILVREYKIKQNIKESNVVDTRGFILYLKNKNDCK